MEITQYKSRLQNLIAQRNGYLVLAAALALISLILVICVCRMINRERIVIVPPVIQQGFWVNSQTVSPEYLSQISSFLVQLRLNMTPSSAEYQREMLLRYTDPAYYGQLKNELVEEADHLAQTHTSLIFYPVDISVDVSHLTAQISGDFSATVSNMPLPVQRLSYRLSFRYAQGRLWLQSFQEITDKTHEPQESKQTITQEDSSHA